jgi:glycosyltransferase involved in cell wall biosynthesis
MPLGRRIRVARIITRLNVGGPALQAVLLDEGLDPDRFETLLIAGSEDPLEGNILEIRGLSKKFLRIPAMRRAVSPALDLRALVQLVRALRAFRPDVVHTHLAKAGSLGRIAAWAAGVPITVHTFHGNVFRGYFSERRAAVFLLIERILARWTTRIIAVSARQATELESLGIARPPRLVRVPEGLDLQPFIAADAGGLRRELDVSEDVPLVGIVGRLVPIKGVDVFLTAASIVGRLRRDAVFVVVGDGESRLVLEAQVRSLGMSEAVRFLGWRADLPSLYASLDVVVLTSHNEGTPLSLMEALATGRPVVATAVGGVPDMISSAECGLLVPDGDAEAVAEAILGVINGSRDRDVAAVRRCVYPEYDVSTLTQRLEDLYASLVETLDLRWTKADLERKPPDS